MAVAAGKAISTDGALFRIDTHGEASGESLAEHSLRIGDETECQQRDGHLEIKTLKTFVCFGSCGLTSHGGEH